MGKKEERVTDRTVYWWLVYDPQHFVSERCVVSAMWEARLWVQLDLALNLLCLHDGMTCHSSFRNILDSTRLEGEAGVKSKDSTSIEPKKFNAELWNWKSGCLGGA